MSPQPAQTAPSPPAAHAPSREEEAAAALNSTRFSRGARALLLAGFVTFLVSCIVASCLESFSNQRADSSPSTPSPLLGLLPNWSAIAKVGGPLDFWRLLPSPEATRSAEKALEERSIIAAALRPRLQSLLYRVARAGNEQVAPAPGGWLFFRKDLDYLNSKPFLDPAVQADRARAASVAPDSLAAIVDFEKQLASRGIRLLVVPIPVKPCIEAHRFNPGGRPAAEALQNASYSAWLAALKERGVSVFDTAPILQERAQRTGEPQFLRTDTHWTPEAMEAVAKAVARKIEPETVSAEPESPSRGSMQVTAQGDTVALLGLPKEQSLIPPQTVTIHPVLQNGLPWKPAQEADVLLLGDSFSNIYSLGAMGWGEGAGFPEHLSASLGRPIDTLLRNSDGAFATRQMLQKELASGSDRLRGKTVVIWEFAARELAFGNWKSLPLGAAEPQDRSFFCPPSGAKQLVRGVIASTSSIPRPGSVPYKEHIVALHLVDVILEGANPGKPRECIVYTWSMREQQPTAAARLRPKDPVSMEIVPWEDVSDALEKFQRSELDDPALLLEPATWAAALR
jgi:alginate O-acetyltransferase complex protein AlgJ